MEAHAQNQLANNAVDVRCTVCGVQCARAAHGALRAGAGDVRPTRLLAARLLEP